MSAEHSEELYREAIRESYLSKIKYDHHEYRALELKLKQSFRERDEAMSIGQELADIASHCLGWHIDVAGNFKSDHTLGLSRKITDTLQRWSKLKEVVK